MRQHQYMRSEYDKCVYYKRLSNNVMIYLLLYVDDMLFVCQDKLEICKLKSQLKERFKMKNLGPTKRILCMEIRRDIKANKLCLFQKNYFLKCLTNLILEQPNQSQLRCLITTSSLHLKDLLLMKTRNLWLRYL